MGRIFLWTVANVFFVCFYYFLITFQNLKTNQMLFNRWKFKQTWYIQTMEYYSVIKRNKLLIYVTTCMNLQRIMLSEEKPISKAGYLAIPFIDHSWNDTKIGEISGCQCLRKGDKSWREASVCRRAKWEILLMMQVFFASSVSISVFLL